MPTVGAFWQYIHVEADVQCNIKAKLTIVIDIKDFIIDIISSVIWSKYIT